MCGGGAVAAVLLLAEKAGRPKVEILGRTDSSGFGGPVVRYLAAAVLSGAGAGGTCAAGCASPPPPLPLSQAVIRAAIYAATEDARFPPVAAAELKNLTIEISVLKPAREITNPRLITGGKH